MKRIESLPEACEVAARPTAYRRRLLTQSWAVLFTAVLALAHTPLALAWGPQGHRTVGAIADQLLRPPARAAVRQLLQDDRDKFDRPSYRTTLEAVSVWADEIYGTPGAHPRWHYDDAPVCSSAPSALYCPDAECNSGQLPRLLALLTDAHAPVRTRNEALKWVVHLVGDLHQPLHVADNADRGGTRVQVALSGVRTRGRESLHRAWDTELAQLALQTRGAQRPPAELPALAPEARELVTLAGQGTPQSWASESNHLARNVAYHYGAFACETVPPSIVVLDAQYVTQASEVVRERLLLAGARLANLLNDAFEHR